MKTMIGKILLIGLVLSGVFCATQSYSMKRGRAGVSQQDTIQMSQDLLDTCAEERVEDAIRLLSNGADPNVCDPETGTTPLHYACYGKKPKLLTALLSDKRIKVNTRDIEGSTALHVACDGKYSAGVAELVKHPGINLEIKNKNEQTALDIAEIRKAFTCAEHLLAHGAEQEPSNKILANVSRAFVWMRLFSQTRAWFKVPFTAKPALEMAGCDSTSSQGDLQTLRLLESYAKKCGCKKCKKAAYQAGKRLFKPDVQWKQNENSETIELFF